MIENNSEILFLFDAKRCNPNGDMDDENKPRMDKNNKINLVSDVRIKRYIRDYLTNFKGEEIFVSSDAKDAKDKGKQLEKQGKKINDCMDVKFFGAVFAQEKKNEHITGPIQFTITESLNRVDLQRSKTITSSFSNNQGIGNDFRVVYSFLATSGSINSNNAKIVNLTEKDISLFQESIIKAIPLCSTRSKIGQYPRLYLQVDTNEDTSLKDLREFIKLKERENLLDISNVELDVSRLKEYLDSKFHIIKKIEYWVDRELKLFLGDEEKKLKDIFANFNAKEINLE